MKKKMTKHEEKEFLNIIMTQDIEFYHEYMERMRKSIGECRSPIRGQHLTQVYHAIECVWVGLNNLKSMVNCPITKVE